MFSCIKSNTFTNVKYGNIKSTRPWRKMNINDGIKHYQYDQSVMIVWKHMCPCLVEKLFSAALLNIVSLDVIVANVHICICV